MGAAPKPWVIEDLAEQRLAEYERLKGPISTPPVPIDHIIEDVAKLYLVWEPISEEPNEVVLGGLRESDREIVLNEKHINLFREKPGLARSTKGHELGHWDIFSEHRAEGQMVLEGMGADSQHFAKRSGKKGDISIILNSWQDPEIYKAYKLLTKNEDPPEVASAVNRYASVLAMPRKMISEYAQRVDLTKWKNLYELRDIFDVTISALVVRLQQLRLCFVKGSKLYKSQEEYNGQMTLEW